MLVINIPAFFYFMYNLNVFKVCITNRRDYAYKNNFYEMPLKQLLRIVLITWPSC